MRLCALDSGGNVNHVDARSTVLGHTLGHRHVWTDFLTAVLISMLTWIFKFCYFTPTTALTFISRALPGTAHGMPHAPQRCTQYRLSAGAGRCAYGCHRSPFDARAVRGREAFCKRKTKTTR